MGKILGREGAAAVVGILICAIFFFQINMICNNVDKHTPIHVVKIASDSSLENGVSAAIAFGLDNYSQYATATIIKKEALAVGYKYYALTAYHCVRSYEDDKVKDETTGKLIIATAKSPLDEPKVFHSTIIGIPYAVPALDWAIFSFESEEDIGVAQLAEKEDVERMKPFEHIYGVGNDAAAGMVMKEGIISAGTNIDPFEPLQTVKDDRVMNKFPKDFARAYMQIWFGASGGPIFNHDGKIIGIIIAIYTEEGAAHDTSFLKVETIRDILSMSRFFKD